jgi:endonuclease/exonuclease/phosphatase family metal-dependent hydrolase
MRSAKVFLRRLFISSAIILLAMYLGTLPAYSENGTGNRTVKVLTYNMDEGTDFIEVLGAQSFPDFLAAVDLTWKNVQASNPARRAELLADQIVGAQPDLVSLQEVTVWVTGTWSWQEMNCKNPQVQIDALTLLMKALARHGAHYMILAQVPEFQLGGPFSDMTGCVAALNTDVILGRVAGKSEKLEYSNVQMQHYTTFAKLPSLIGAIDVPRGWASVDVKVEGKTFRFIGTHLEDGTASPLLALVAGAQVMELLSGPAKTEMPVVLAGDFNSNANDPAGQSYLAYSVVTSYGQFVDAWNVIHPDELGFTWGPDGILPNPDYFRSERIDLIFVRAAGVLGSKLVGGSPQDRVGDYWPSDHAGVSAHVKLP